MQVPNQEGVFHKSQLSSHLLCEGFAQFRFDSHSTYGYADNSFYELVFIISGEWVLLNKSGYLLFNGSSTCLYRPGHVHQWKLQSEDGLILRIPIEKGFYEYWMSCCYPEFSFSDETTHLFSMIPKEKTRYIKYLADMIINGETYPQYYAIEILFLAISSLLSNIGAEGSQNFVTDIIYKLDTFYYINYSVDEICSAYPCARSLLLQKFKDITGTTIVDYKTKKKLEYARQLLLSTKMRIIDIASALQFSSNSYFLQRFKEEFNCTPSEYRERNKLQSAQPQGEDLND